ARRGALRHHVCICPRRRPLFAGRWSEDRTGLLLRLSEVTIMRAQQSTIVGVFDDRLQADRAVDELRRAGFRDDQIGVAMRYDAGDATTAGTTDAADATDADDTHAGT